MDEAFRHFDQQVVKSITLSPTRIVVTYLNLLICLKVTKYDLSESYLALSVSP